MPDTTTHTTTAALTSQCQMYRVQMACGHHELRMMRAETAGTPWLGPDTVAARTAINVCVMCDPRRAEFGAVMAPTQWRRADD